MHKIRRLLITFTPLLCMVFTLILITPRMVSANSSYSTMEFKFELPGDDIEIIDGTLWSCSDEDCHEKVNETSYFKCAGRSCSTQLNFATYSDYPYYQLVIKFSDGSRESDIFNAQAYHAKFTVRVEGDSLILSEIYDPKSYFSSGTLFALIIRLILTIPLEILVGLVFCRLLEVNKSLLIRIILANLLSQSFMAFILPWLLGLLPTLTSTWQIFMMEVSVMIIDALVLLLPSRKYRISAFQVILLSIIMNLVSYFLPIFIISLI
jgi:hypothetical protein